MAAFVLVHGAWHGAWCWHRIVEGLTDRGHEVLALDLPGHGDDGIALTEVSLEAYVAQVVETLEKHPEPVVLVGHSLGGLSITHAASRVPERIQALVYLAALLPEPRVDLETMSASLGDAMLLEGDLATQGIRLRLDGAREVFYHDCPEDDIALAQARLVPQAIAPLLAAEVPAPGAWSGLPRVYVECTRDRVIPIEIQRAIHGHNGLSVETLETGHSPFFAEPEALLEVLERIAG